MAEAEFISWAITTIMGFAMYMLKRTLDTTQENIRELQREQSKIKEDYLHKNDFREFKTELRSMFEEIRTDIKELKK